LGRQIAQTGEVDFGELGGFAPRYSRSVRCRRRTVDTISAIVTSPKVQPSTSFIEGTLSMRKTPTPRCTPVHGAIPIISRAAHCKKSTLGHPAQVSVCFHLAVLPGLIRYWIHPKARPLTTLCSACPFWWMLVTASVASIPR